MTGAPPNGLCTALSYSIRPRPVRSQIRDQGGTSTMRNNVHGMWRGVIAAAPLSILMVGGLAMAEPMEGASSEGTSAAPVCKDSGVTINFGIGSSEIDRNGKGAL